ncbi:MAG: flap endonuclease-1 [Candidatus Asgardarchaeia archaeon]
MGVKLKDLITPKIISFDYLVGKYVAIDALNAIYQFMAIIRQPDGTPLMDHNGYITSHLSGLFYRTINFVELGLKPVYVFDGKPPDLKTETIKKRMEIREAAKEKWIDALRRGDIVTARKYAQAAIEINEAILTESKSLLSAMGIPVVQAPSEGEAQAAYMARKGDVWASASQDYDSLLFGSPRLIRNLTLRRKRKIAGTDEFKEVDLELVTLDDALKTLGITREQLIDIAILIGTDYNEGVKGIGPKKAYSLIKKHKSLDNIIKLKLVDLGDTPIDKIREIFLNPEVTDDYVISWEPPNPERIKEILVNQHDFSLDRVEKGIERLTKAYSQTKQESLESWFG